MIAITQAEKQAILEKYPWVHIVRTMKQDSKRHHYYMAEDSGPMRMLRGLRGHSNKGAGTKGSGGYIQYGKL
jgi:hypothetical protein